MEYQDEAGNTLPKFKRLKEICSKGFQDYNILGDFILSLNINCSLLENKARTVYIYVDYNPDGTRKVRYSSNFRDKDIDNMIYKAFMKVPDYKPVTNECYQRYGKYFIYMHYPK